MVDRKDIENILKGALGRPTGGKPAEGEPTPAEPSKAVTAPQKTATAPQKTAAAPQKTATAPGKTIAAPGQSQLSGSATPPHAAPQPTHAVGGQITVGGKTYTVEQVLGSGTEGELYVVSSGKKRFALKLCRQGYKPNDKVLRKLRNLKGKGYVVDTLEWGDDYELMEYIPGGSAAEAGLKGNAQAILTIVAKVAMALDRMHREGVLHKDVKPANILITNPQTWDCVLCDFGISDLLTDRGTCITNQVRTPVYAAPEIYTDTVTLPEGIFIELSAKADFYALGMTILSLWMGEGAFLAKEAELAIDKKKGRIAIPADMPDKLARICRGLLIGNPDKRWDWPEIEATIKGKTVAVEEDHINADLGIVFNATKHQVANTPLELAALMAADKELAKKYLYRGQVERWLKPYPELVLEMQDIVEKRHPKDMDTGLMAAIFTLDPLFPLELSGTSRKDGSALKTTAVTLKDVSNFCNDAIPDDHTVTLLIGDTFVEWVRVRSADLASRLARSSQYTYTYMLRVQTIDPLSDINLINDPSDPDYAMTQEGLGRLLNKIYNIYWGTFRGNSANMAADWHQQQYAPLNLRIPADTLINITNNFKSPEDYHYFTDSLDTKGQRFRQQRSWFVHCTDRNSDDYLKKCGPKGDTSRVQFAWMKVIRGYGVTPEYEFSDGRKVTTLQQAFAADSKTLKDEYENHGLRGFLAVHHQEDPTADYKPQFTYERRLKDYLDDLRKIDSSMLPVTRFDQAQEEADKLLSAGKLRIGSLTARGILQIVATSLLAILPALILLAALIFSIVDNPLIDVGSMRLDRYIWIVGLILGVIFYFVGDFEGCTVPIVIGVIAAGLLMVVVKFLGQFILYFYAAIVIAVLVFFSIKTIFFKSPYRAKARKFSKPGFDEKVLEPLYHAFSSDSFFDSSLNGAFNDYDLDNWNDDLKIRRRYMWIFVGAVWFLTIFSVFLPKSERFEKFSASVTERIELMKKK